MRNLLSCILMVLLTFGLFINDASAKRFGGGRSFGAQRSHSSFFSSPKSQTAGLKGQRSAKNKWGGMLGGMLIGGLLASLFMGHGLANGLITWLILGSIIFFIIHVMRKKMQPGLQFAQSSAFNTPSHNNVAPSSAFNRPGMNFNQHSNDFDEESFLRTAKVTFIRLQAAYDHNNLPDIHSFTVPEVYAEITMQLEERGAEPNKTEIIDLKAALLDVSKQTHSTVASVRFTGSLKENGQAMSELNEIWHFTQSSHSSEWVVSGVQQAM